MIREDCFYQTIGDGKSPIFKRKDTATQINQVALEIQDLQLKDITISEVKQLPLSAGCAAGGPLLINIWSEFIEKHKVRRHIC